MLQSFSHNAPSVVYSLCVAHSILPFLILTQIPSIWTMDCRLINIQGAFQMCHGAPCISFTQYHDRLRPANIPNHTPSSPLAEGERERSYTPPRCRPSVGLMKWSVWLRGPASYNVIVVAIIVKGNLIPAQSKAEEMAVWVVFRKQFSMTPIYDL